VCQVHAAVDAVVQSWWLDRQSADTLISRVADRLQYHQQRNALARRAHGNTTKRELRRIGINVSTLKRCDLDTS
jgi:hypothetical protein